MKKLLAVVAIIAVMMSNVCYAKFVSNLKEAEVGDIWYYEQMKVYCVVYDEDGSGGYIFNLGKDENGELYMKTKYGIATGSVVEDYYNDYGRVKREYYYNGRWDSNWKAKWEYLGVW